MYKWIAVSVFIVLIDLFFKYWIKEHYAYGQGFGILNNFIQVMNISNVGMASGFRYGNSFDPIVLIPIVFHLLILLLFIRVQKLSIGKLFKISTMFILFGIIGNYLDQFLLSKGEMGYVNMDYLYISSISSALFNLSSLLSYTGWILLFIAIVTNFRDVSKIFKRENPKNEGGDAENRV